MKKPQTKNYRIDFLMFTTRTWAEYTALRKPNSDLNFIKSLAEGLKRLGQPGRIVTVTGREKSAADFIEVIEEWKGAKQ